MFVKIFPYFLEYQIQNTNFAVYCFRQAFCIVKSDFEMFKSLNL